MQLWDSPRGVLMTAFFNYENPEFLGISSFMPDFPVSSIVDNIILLSMIEIRSVMGCITVVKARGSKHEFDSREYEIGEGGINLVPFDERSTRHLSRYTSILSRAPTRMRAKERRSRAMFCRLSVHRSVGHLIALLLFRWSPFVRKH